MLSILQQKKRKKRKELSNFLRVIWNLTYATIVRKREAERTALRESFLTVEYRKKKLKLSERRRKHK